MKAAIGAGIVVSAEGMVVTSQHVVRDCASISVLDPQSERAFAAAASFRSGAPLQAGESVTVVGYPLAGIPGFEPNVAFGHASALGRLRGDASRFQISAPIRKGNSGGPILGQDGHRPRDRSAGGLPPRRQHTPPDQPVLSRRCRLA